MKRLTSVVLAVAFGAACFLGGAWLTWRVQGTAQPATARRVLYWVDPMHPSYKSDKPGIAPDCGMQLEPVYADDPAVASGRSMPPDALRVRMERQQVLGIRVGQVARVPVTRTIRTVGRVAVDENRIYRLIAAGEGTIRELFPNSAGSLVRQDQLLLTFYSRDSLAAQQAFIYALNTFDRVSAGKEEPTDQSSLTRDQVRQATESLQALGMSNTQIAAIARTRQRVATIELRSPVSGYVLERNTSPNQRFDRATEFYRIADLTSVWVLADLFEGDARFVQPGAAAQISLPYSQEPPVSSQVSDVLPQFDPATRTLKVRLDAPNPGFALRPGMFVDVKMSVRLPEAIMVPADAVVDSGIRKTVFVDLGNGYFEPRRVETGGRVDERIEVTRGLMPGERIIVAGNFLIDSESRMKLAATGISVPEADPVCGMSVDRSKASAAGHVAAHKGRTYYFCSDTCAKQFEANPAAYAEGDAAPPPSPGRTLAYPVVRATALAAGRGGRDSGVMSESGDLSGSEPAAPTIATGHSVFRTDPVCGADVETTAPNVLKTIHAGKTYYFLTEACKAEFDKDPARYAAKSELRPPAAGAAPPAVETTLDDDAARLPEVAATVALPATPLVATPADRRAGYHARPGLPRVSPSGAPRPEGGTTDPRPSDAPARREPGAREQIDPVCGGLVDQTQALAAGLAREFNGKTYYFRSEECRRKFDQEPLKYAGKQ
jgi:membrane fusion protein, copper/silver efflux system